MTTLSNVPDIWVEDENVTNKIFEKCPNLTLIISASRTQRIRPQYGEILDGVKNISKIEYVNGDVLSNLVIPKTVESIEEGTFENCFNLKNIKADPKWLNRLPKWQIERLVVPDWVLEVHEKDFDCCYKLKELIFENDNTKLCGESCDAFENIKSIKCSAITASSMSKNAKKNLKKLEIKEGTIEIGEQLGSFYNLEKIALPETLRRIKSNGLSYCKNLKYIKIPDGVESIEEGAFKGSQKIEMVFCNLKLLKYLPKNQIKIIRLKDENIDINKVIENDCKGIIIAGVENILSAALRGEELNAGVIGRELKNAAIEGASAGALNWLAGELAGKNASKLVGKPLAKLAGKKLPEISKLAAGKIAKLPKLAGGKMAKLPELAKGKLNELAKIPELAGERLSELASRRLPIPAGAGGEDGFSRGFGGANISKWKPPVEVPKPLLAKAKASNLKPGGEVVLPKVKSYEQARNKIFELIGDDLTGLNSEPLIGRLESSMGCDKVIGRISKDKKLRWRLNYDDIKGPYMHIDDFREGKWSLSKKNCCTI